MDTDAALIRRLAATQGDVQAQAAVMAAFLVTARPRPDRLRAALDAAAVLHWFEPGLLARVLGIPADEAREGCAGLTALGFVEAYGPRDAGLFNVHESARLGWRRQLAAEAPGRFRDLSARAAGCFAGDRTPAGRIEWVYHLLCGDPERGADALESLNREWSGSARPEDRAALAWALDELAATGLVMGRARAWTLLVGAWVRASRGETAQLADTATEALRLARDCQDDPALGDAHCLLGDVRQAQGRLADAQAAFTETLAISRRLAEQDPDNAGWQRDLAVAHSRVGDILQAQGQLAWARAAFAEYVAVCRRLAEQDPGNAGWQRELAAACWWLAHVAARLGQPQTALPLYEESARLFAALVERAPGFRHWAEESAFVEAALAYYRSRLATTGSVLAVAQQRG